MDHKGLAKMFTAVELSRLYKHGQLDKMLQQLNGIINPHNLIATATETSVFNYTKNGEKYVAKVVPRNIRFFKHFGKHHSAEEFKKYINRLDPYFLPVKEILYEDKNIFVYSQEKCDIVESKRISKTVVIEVFHLIQFMLVNRIMLTDLAPHNLGIVRHHVVVFDYHGLHRLMKDGEIYRDDWWRRLARNLTRFMTALIGAHKRAEYSALMQNCDDKVIKKMENDPEIPKIFSTMIRYMATEQGGVVVEKLIEYLEKCINELKTKK
jgi:hypothetical protein